MIHCSFTATQPSKQGVGPATAAGIMHSNCADILMSGICVHLEEQLKKTLEPTSPACCLEMATRVTAKNLLNLLFSVQQLALGLLLLLL